MFWLPSDIKGNFHESPGKSSRKGSTVCVFVLPKEDNHIINRKKKKRPLSKQECPNTPRCLKLSYAQHPNCLFPLFVGNLLTFPDLTESEKPSNFPPQFNKIAGVTDWPVPASQVNPLFEGSLFPSRWSLRTPTLLRHRLLLPTTDPSTSPSPPALTLPGRPRPLAPRPLRLPNRVPESLPQALKGDPALGTRPSSRPQSHPPTPHRVFRWRASGRGPAPRASLSGVPGGEDPGPSHAPHR